MLMTPQYTPACYADMYRGHVPAYPSAVPPSAASAPVSQHHSYHQNNNVTPEFYSNSPQMTGNCYESNPSHLDHGSITMDNNSRPVVNPYGYNSCTMQTMDQTLNMYPSQSMWQNPLVDDKRGPVIMGQPPPQPPVKRKGGRKPKDDPNLPPMEKEKRRLRRLRNKEAAAKCRERRLNHTSSLLQQIEHLEDLQKANEEKISQLRRHKEDCEKLLQDHSQECSKTFSVKSPSSSSSLSSQSSQPSSSPVSAIKTPSPPHHTDNAGISCQPSSNRRKQSTPRLNIAEGSCSDLHRRTSSSSSGDLQSPPIIHS